MVNTEKLIISFLNKYDYDIRKTNDARFMDQKVTPDVLCIISDCVINFLEVKKNRTLVFAIKDIWQSEYFNQNVKGIFSKPDANDQTAKHEYDKFISQPLKMLCYSKVLSCQKKHSNYFKVENYEILEYISLKDKNAFNFLHLYLSKVLKDSNLLNHFDNFRENNSKKEFDFLKSTFVDFIKKHTNIEKNLEPKRIFPKILNIYAVKNQICGTKDGRISTNIMTFSDLLYNRSNWRDKKKDKHKTRKNYTNLIEQNKDAYDKYSIIKAKNIIKRTHYSSEVKDDYSIGEATQVHHIFPKSNYPKFASYLENLILLTPTQHLTKAHPNNHTNIISYDYQLLCLIYKSRSIESCIMNKESSIKIYSKEKFIEVINTGLKQRFHTKTTFKEIRKNLFDEYNKIC